MSSTALEGADFAAVDLGSNSFHMVVARYEHGELRVMDRLRDMVRLAEGVDKKGNLDAAVGERCLAALARFGQRISSFDPEHVRAVGTNALRQIDDGGEFLECAGSALGFPIEIISGREEARLIYAGVAQGISPGDRKRLVADIGGGSTEIIAGRGFQPKELESLPYGCVGVTRKFFSDGRITLKRWHKARTAVALELQTVVQAYRRHGWDEVMGCSGTLKAIRAAVVDAGWCVRGITAEALHSLRGEMINAGSSDALELPTLSSQRRPVFVGGVVIAEALFDALDIDLMLVPLYALREGVLYDLLGRVQHQDPRDASISALMGRYGVDVSQAERVSDTAATLFDQVAATWQLDDDHRDWLLRAANIHEIGLAIAHGTYEAHGAYLIEHSDMPGFSRQDQQILGTLVRYHRGKPTLEAFDELPARHETAALKVCAVLRLAVLLNRSRGADELPDVAATASGAQIQVSLDGDWLADHPLTDADLKAEADRLDRISITLTPPSEVAA